VKHVYNPTEKFPIKMITISCFIAWCNNISRSGCV